MTVAACILVKGEQAPGCCLGHGACSKQHRTVQPVLPLHISWPSNDLQCCILLGRGSYNVLELGERALTQSLMSWLTPGANSTQQCCMHAGLRGKVAPSILCKR